MAEGKKSFVLYTDLIYTVKKLPKEKQAELFMLILEYVNDLNPKTEDILLDVAFEPIKRQLKRDLQKYEERAMRSRENGSKGGRPAKNDNLEEPKKPNGLFQNPTEPRKPDNVTVTDNVNVTVISNGETALDEEKKIEEVKAVFASVLKSQLWMETTCMKNKRDEFEVTKHFHNFYYHFISIDGHKKEKFDESSIKKHFNNWINKGNPIPQIPEHQRRKKQINME